ncbi:class I SAM-dependent DNA methyltransferase [Gemmatimonadota bacterium]
MFSESAELYDLIYDQFKDYKAEAAQVAGLLQALRPTVGRVLDVGCGTGQHAHFLSEDFGYSVDGLDIEPKFLELARARCPGGDFFQGDMADFRLNRQYDVVLCLFSSIGYVKTPARLAETVRCLKEHLVPGGLVVVEPWFTPQDFRGGSVHVHTVEEDDLKICRVGRSEVQNGVSLIEFQYLVAQPGGIRHMKEIHELGLFTKSEMREALLAAGLQIVQEEERGLVGDRGLFVAERGD